MSVIFFILGNNISEVKVMIRFNNQNFRRVITVLTVIALFFGCFSAAFQNDSVSTLSKLGSRGNEVRKIQTKLKE